MSTELPLVGDYSAPTAELSGARIGVAVFPGTLGDRDVTRALTLAGATPVSLWYEDTDLSNVDAVILPGGASYGDYMRPGALAAQAPLVKAIVAAAEAGTPILGTGNGFHVLTEAGILPGVLGLNESARYHVTAQPVKVESTKTAFTGDYTEGEELVLPLKSKYGNYFVDAATASELESSGRVVLRYVSNPNGSVNDIAGVANAAGNVVGLLPQVEYAVENGFGPSVDGAKVFTSILRTLAGGK